MAQLTLNRAFELALQHHGAGRLGEAEQLYRQILAHEPGHADAWHYLGMIAAQVGRNDIAVDLIRRAIALNPSCAEAHNNLGNALKNSGQIDEAETAYRRAITLMPGLSKAHINLGNTLKEKGQLDEATTAYRQAMALDPYNTSIDGRPVYALHFERVQTDLCKLFLKYYSDKCPEIKHSYSPAYYEFLKDYRETFLNIIEIGIGNDELMKPICGQNYQAGASLKAWRDFFGSAHVYGLDIRREVLFSEERIACFYTDQSNRDELLKSITEIRRSANDEKLLFDLIIDDGSHVVEHMVLSVQVLSKYVKPGGFYIIEDIKRGDLSFFEKLKLDGFEIMKTHRGLSLWDDFIIYKNMK